MYRFGWWTTGRDQAAIDLLEASLRAIKSGDIRGEISYVFCSREKGESVFSDKILKLASENDIPSIAFSAIKFLPDLRMSDRARWRDEYHREVLKRLSDLEADCAVLAGYMWVVSEDACNALKLLNLHPALPGGPEGTWQEVIWKLIEDGAGKTGAMMHLVTPELDKGPPVAYFSFDIKGPAWEPLWEDLRGKISRYGSLARVKEEVGEELPLFRRIREEGVKRELPLIVATLAAISKGEIDLQKPVGPVELEV